MFVYSGNQMKFSSGGHPPISRFSQFLVNPALQQGTPDLVACIFNQVWRKIFLILYSLQIILQVMFLIFLC